MAREDVSLPCPKIERGQKKLTPEQAAYARQFALERIAVMLSTDSIDEAEAEEHLRAVYRVAGREPVPVRWFDSPISFMRTPVSGVVEIVKGSGGAIVENSVWEVVGHSVPSDVKHSVWGSVMLWVADSVGESVGEIAWQSVMESVGDSGGSSVQAYLNANGFAFSRFFHEVFEENRLIHLALFNELVSGYRLGSTEARVVRKPIRLKRDEQGRLHSADGMCMQYRDGWGFYAWHGVRCCEQLILHPEQLTGEDWLNEHNVEVRRAIQELLGNERFIELIGGKQIDTGRRGKLIEIQLGPHDPERVAHYVQVQDSSTERHYYLRVPPSITSADEALAWTFGLNETEYQPGQET